MARFFTGAEGTVAIGSVELPITNWSATLQTELFDMTNANTGGVRTYLAGLKECRGEFTFYWDAAANPTTDPPNLNPGATVALRLFLENNSGPFLEVPTGIVEALRLQSRVDGIFAATATFRASGPFTAPTGNF